MNAPLARTSDPVSSHLANYRISTDMPLREQIMAAAKSIDPGMFDDWDLLELIEEATARRQQRNVIARTRGLMERDGLFVRVGLRPSPHANVDTLHFTLPPPTVTQLSLLEGDGHGQQ